MTHTQKRPVARGVRKDRKLAVVVAFDEETFDAIRQRAISEGTSFGEQVRTLVEWGLDDAEAYGE
ncbi:MAG: hypothetical protein MI755_16455 [Sphingomonadales bacterium]|nr:hypothetical protein [Sphingomonadales bacterium]